MGGFCSVLDAVLCDESPPPEQKMSGEHVRDLSSEVHHMEHSTAELMKQRTLLIRFLDCVDKQSEVLESLRARQTDARSNSRSESLPVRRSKGPTPLLPKIVHSLSEDGHLPVENLLSGTLVPPLRNIGGIFSAVYPRMICHKRICLPRLMRISTGRFMNWSRESCNRWRRKAV